MILAVFNFIKHPQQHICINLPERSKTMQMYLFFCITSRGARGFLDDQQQ